MHTGTGSSPSVFATEKFEFFSSVIRTLEAKNESFRLHSSKVALYSYQIARKLGLPEQSAKLTFWASAVHDLGCIDTPEELWRKATPLNEHEVRMVRRHPVVGAKILEPVGAFKPIVPLVYHHHERFDGKGYPDGLKGEEIPLLSRIILAAEAYDAMSCARSHRPRLSAARIAAEFETGAGTQFDPQVAAALLELVRSGDLLSAEQAIEYCI